MTRLASAISDWTTMMEIGLLATCRPFFRMLTWCSPTSRGMKEIPGGRRRRETERREGRKEGGEKEEM